MGWFRRPSWVTPFEAESVREELTAAATVTEIGVNSRSVTASRNSVVKTYESWQHELWDYYDDVGEFTIAVMWRASMLSRVRLRAARKQPGTDEPKILDSGPAADLVAELCNDSAGRAEMMSSISALIDIPGECYLVGETRRGEKNWMILSADEIRISRRNEGYEVLEEINGSEEWRPLGTDSLITRIWRPHRRYRYRATSPAKAARTAMRELELVNRHIQAQYLSRLASAGVIIFPDELSFPVRPEYADAADPFTREWIETAAQAIKNPGTAASIVPIPMRVPGEYVDKVQHVDFTLKNDDKIIEKRESARRRLASMINVPAELLFDAADVNHWGLWQIEEGALKVYITPDVEVITNALTKGYLHPRLRAMGESTEDIIMWYDASELLVRPDRSRNVTEAYDRHEVSGKTYRRELGLDEDDKPTPTELQDQLLRALVKMPNHAVAALEALTGLKIADSQVQSEEDPTDPDEPDDDTNDPNTPATEKTPPPAPGKDIGVDAAVKRRAEWDAQTLLQARSQHIIEFNMAGWKLKHPLLCQTKLFSCPFTYETRKGIPIHPGTSGDYSCTLSARGNLTIGERVFPRESDLITVENRVNGSH